MCEVDHEGSIFEVIAIIRLIKLLNLIMDKILIRYMDNGSSRYDGKEYLEATSRI